MIDSYILCSSPRSGATLLSEMLRDTGVAGWPGQHLRGAQRRAMMDSMATGEVGEVATARRTLQLAREAGTRDGIFALGLEPGGLPAFRSMLAVLHPDLPDDAARITAELGRTRVIYLKRQDLLGRAVSMLRTLQTGYWFEDADGNETEAAAPGSIPVYDRTEIAGKMEEFAGMDAAWELWFEAEGITPICIEHESLITDPLAALARLLGELGLDPAAAAAASPQPEEEDAEGGDWVRRFREEALI